MFMKLATGTTNLGLQDLFGERNDQRISDIYNHTIRWLDQKAQGLFHQPCLEQWKDNFHVFAGVIEHKLGEEAYGGLQYNNFKIIGFVDCKISETYHLGSSPAEDMQQAPRHNDAWILQESIYSSYIRCHGLKILTVVSTNGLIGYGDAIFPILHGITHQHRTPIGGQLTARQIAEDSGMSQIRTSVEWLYETATNLFYMLHSKYNKHFLKHDRTVNDIIHISSLEFYFSYITVMFVWMGATFLVSLMYSLLV
jgi:hypothetical protein